MSTKPSLLLVTTALSIFALQCTPAPVDDNCDPAPTSVGLAGAFDGIAYCGNGVERRVSLLLSQEEGDDDVDGSGVIDWNVQYIDGLINVTLAHSLRGQLLDAELDDNLVLTGVMLTETLMGTANANDFTFELQVDATNAALNTMTGTWSYVDDDLNPISTCDVVMARVGHELPAYTGGETADAGM